MKNILFLFCIFSFFNLSFVSCGDDDNDNDNDNDETFVTNDDVRAREMIKGKWIMTSSKIESNYPGFDKPTNEAFVQSLKENFVDMVFETEYVHTNTTPKSGNLVVPSTLEKYYFSNNALYVEELSMSMTMKNSYKISEKTLVIIGDFTYDILLKTLQTEARRTGLDYTEIINAIPLNFSGKLIYTFKR